MLAVQGFSIGAEIASWPVDLLTLSEHISLSVQRWVGQCSQSVMLLFQLLILSGEGMCWNNWKGIGSRHLLVHISSINSAHSEWWDGWLSTPKILDCLLIPFTTCAIAIYTYTVIEGSVEILSLGSDVTLFLQKRQFFQWASELDLAASFLKVVAFPSS